MDSMLVTNGSRIASDGGLLDIVSRLSTNDEALVANDSVNVSSWTLEQVKEGADVESRLLEVCVQLGAISAGVGLQCRKDFSLETLCNVLVELELGVKRVEGGPVQSAGNACIAI